MAIFPNRSGRRNWTQSWKSMWGCEREQQMRWKPLDEANRQKGAAHFAVVGQIARRTCFEADPAWSKSVVRLYARRKGILDTRER